MRTTVMLSLFAVWVSASWGHAPGNVDLTALETRALDEFREVMFGGDYLRYVNRVVHVPAGDGDVVSLPVPIAITAIQTEPLIFLTKHHQSFCQHMGFFLRRLGGGPSSTGGTLVVTAEDYPAVVDLLGRERASAKVAVVESAAHPSYYGVRGIAVASQEAEGRGWHSVRSFVDGLNVHLALTPP